MGKKGNWFSALKKAFTSSSKDKNVHVSAIYVCVISCEKYDSDENRSPHSSCGILLDCTI